MWVIIFKDFDDQVLVNIYVNLFINLSIFFKFANPLILYNFNHRRRRFCRMHIKNSH